MSINNIDTLLWTEKYRPNTLDKCLLPSRIKSMLSTGAMQNMLLCGSAGIGKTTVAKAICHQFGHNTLYINGSTENSIDTIRNRITDFAMNQSILHYDNPIKVVLIDEADGLSRNAQDGLRATMEQFAANTRFILTCNWPEKIIEPIKSRCQAIDFDFSNDEIKEVKKLQILRVIDICKVEGMEIERVAAGKIVLNYYPDFRTVINHLQRFKLEGKSIITEGDIKDTASEFAELYELVINTSNPVDNYKFILSKYSSCIDEAVASLGNPFMNYIIKCKQELVSKLPTIAILNAKYQQNLKNCIDPVIVLLANVFELQKEFSE